MIQILLYRFFNILKFPDKYFSEDNLAKFIINPSLIQEISLIRKFKSLWRSSLNYNLIKEKYKIKKVEKYNEPNGIKIIIKVLHSFKLNNNTYNNYSKECLKYIFFIKKINHKFMIVDIYNEEYYPTLYKKVLNNEFNFFDENNKTISSIRDNFKIQYWKDKINKIEEMISSFKNNIITPYYRSKENKYDRYSAVSYARRYALNYNPEYKDFNNSGGDCTNYISQCINAGGIKYTNSWKPYTDTWVRVNGLYNYLINNKYAQNIDINEDYQAGDIIQFYSNTKGFYSHSGIITMPLLNGDYLYCCHSYDKLDFPLSEIYPLLYNKFRVLKIIY